MASSAWRSAARPRATVGPAGGLFFKVSTPWAKRTWPRLYSAGTCKRSCWLATVVSSEASASRSLPVLKLARPRVVIVTGSNRRFVFGAGAAARGRVRRAALAAGGGRFRGRPIGRDSLCRANCGERERGARQSERKARHPALHLCRHHRHLSRHDPGGLSVARSWHNIAACRRRDTLYVVPD